MRAGLLRTQQSFYRSIYRGIAPAVCAVKRKIAEKTIHW